MTGAPRRPLGDRNGAGLVEALVTLLLTLGLLALAGTLLMRQQRVATSLGHRVEWIEAARIGRDLLDVTLAADPGPRGAASDLPVRTFVGVAVRCADDGWVYRGRRLPDPDRDSVQVVSGSGRLRAVELAAVGSGDCPVVGAGETGIRVEADPTLAPTDRVLRIFERGVWRVDDAVRYRRGRSGAQPLTAPVLDPRVSGLEVGPDGAYLVMSPGDGTPEVARRWRFP